MDFETLAGIYTYAMHYHGGQASRLYRLMSRIQFNAPDHVFNAIEGNRHAKQDRIESESLRYGRKRATEYTQREWEEWEQARMVYRKLKRRKAE